MTIFYVLEGSFGEVTDGVAKLVPVGFLLSRHGICSLMVSWADFNASDMPKA